MISQETIERIFETSQIEEIISDYVELKKAGVSEDLIRLSIGIENVSDIISDIKQAIEKIFRNQKKKTS